MPSLLNPYRYSSAPPAYTHANLIRRYAADAITGLSDGNAVAARFIDQVGGSNAMGNATGANQPIYKTNIKNGLPVVRFDTTDWTEDFGVGIGSSGITIAIARELDTTAGTTVQAWNGTTGSGGGPLIISGNKSAYARAVAIDQDGAATTNWERWILCLSTVGGAGSTRLFVNGVKVVNTTTTMFTPASGSTIRFGASDGASQVFGTPNQLSGGMDLGEGLFFDASLNDADAAGLDSYLSRWT